MDTNLQNNDGPQGAAPALDTEAACYGVQPRTDDGQEVGPGINDLESSFRNLTLVAPSPRPSLRALYLASHEPDGPWCPLRRRIQLNNLERFCARLFREVCAYCGGLNTVLFSMRQNAPCYPNPDGTLTYSIYEPYLQRLCRELDLLAVGDLNPTRRDRFFELREVWPLLYKTFAAPVVREGQTRGDPVRLSVLGDPHITPNLERSLALDAPLSSISANHARLLPFFVAAVGPLQVPYALAAWSAIQRRLLDRLRTLFQAHYGLSLAELGKQRELIAAGHWHPPETHEAGVYDLVAGYALERNLSLARRGQPLAGSRQTPVRRRASTDGPFTLTAWATGRDEPQPLSLLICKDYLDEDGDFFTDSEPDEPVPAYWHDEMSSDSDEGSSEGFGSYTNSDRSEQEWPEWFGEG